MSLHNTLPFLEMKKSFEAKALMNNLAYTEEESPLLNLKLKANKNLNLSTQNSNMNTNRSILD